MENEQKTQYNQAPQIIKKGMSTGAAIVLGISGIIIAAIIAAAIIFASGAKTVRDIDFDKFDGFNVQVDENGEQTNVNIEVQTPTEDNSENIYSALGFSIVLPEGVTASSVQQAEGGPYQYVLFSDGTAVMFTSNIDWDNQYGSFPGNNSVDLLTTIGDNQFYSIHAPGGRVTYYIEQNGMRYEISQGLTSQIDLTTFEIK